MPERFVPIAHATMRFCLTLVFLTGTWYAQSLQAQGQPKLVQLFHDWRQFETPPMLQGAPDYTEATFARRRPAFEQLRQRLHQTDTTGWSLAEKHDWKILWAEMNGYDFNQRFLKPWQRDPAFYKSIWTERSDVPAHEGPTHHRTTEVWTYQFPLDKQAKKKLLADLEVIPPLCEQAQKNLTGNARDLWITGIRDIRAQHTDLQSMLELPGVADDKGLRKAIAEAMRSTQALVQWLEAEAPRKTGPSGMGKEQYTWYQQNVHLLPLTWEEEVLLLQHELQRAWAALKLEEQRNRHLPALAEATDEASYRKLAQQSASSLLHFLDTAGIVTVKPYFDTALQAHLGSYVPAAKRHFFWITAHYDPRPLYSHFYHWFELARIDREPMANPIRQGPLLYNLWDTRNEGIATAMEEWLMHAGMYDATPRVRELVYILIAQRAARGLGSLYAHANLMTMEQAGGIHSTYTPRGWMKTEPELRIFEQHLYLRQPGYGTSYITGKHILEKGLAEYGRLKENEGKPMLMKNFLDQLNAIGCIPASLAIEEILTSAQ